MPSQVSQKEVVARVRRALEQRLPGSMVIDVLDAAIRYEEGWWYVPVRPREETLKTPEYYSLLAEVEGDLEDAEQLKVLLLPTAPDEEGDPGAASSPSGGAAFGAGTPEPVAEVNIRLALGSLDQLARVVEALQPALPVPAAPDAQERETRPRRGGSARRPRTATGTGR